MVVVLVVVVVVVVVSGGGGDGGVSPGACVEGVSAGGGVDGGVSPGAWVGGELVVGGVSPGACANAVADHSTAISKGERMHRDRAAGMPAVVVAMARACLHQRAALPQAGAWIDR